MAYQSPGVYVNEVPSGNAPIAGASTSTAAFIGVSADSVNVPDPLTPPTLQNPSPTVAFSVMAAGQVALCTSFGEFKASFGDFSTDPGQNALAHAVFGFFNNGGTRCYVTRLLPPSGTLDLQPALDLIAPIDEISIVAAPLPDPAALPGTTFDAQVNYAALSGHCELLQSRFAILDSQASYVDFKNELKSTGTGVPAQTEYAAFYFPWITVFDPTTKARKSIAPSGHLAGIYARVDDERGVHKAPANEIIRGALDVATAVSRPQQDGLNLHGVNCIRSLNGGIRVWGARTVHGDQSLDFTYVSTRRLFIFLRESIDRGLQWAVFEPNNADLWAKITRNTSAFLRTVWSAGALFGATPEEAFFVKCDAETNPPNLRDLGQVVTQIGIAITKPAEFVIFNIGQKTNGT